MIEKIRVAEEVFVIPDGKYFFLYAPLARSIVKVNSGTVNLLKEIEEGKVVKDKITEKLLNHGILTSALNKFPKREKKDIDYCPTGVTLIPTYRCNLRCIYCYSSGGEDAGLDMSQEIAFAAIDFIIQNAISTKKKRVHLGFHGGGEPLAAFQLVKRATEYFKKKVREEKLSGNLSIATNGVLNKETLEWVIKNFNSINLSFDGMADIQGRQRPLINGENSFPYVIETIKELEKNKFKYGIRSTITAESVERLPDILRFFRSITSVKSFHFESLFECGRCKTTKAKAASPLRFISQMKKTMKIAYKMGVEIYHAGTTLDGIHDHFCGAIGTNFFVIPTGKITTCLEISRESDEMADIFQIGGYDGSKFSIDRKKIELLLLRKVQKIPFCKDCFAKYNCAGDCLAKSYSQTGSLFSNNGNKRCEVNRQILFERIKNLKSEVCYGKEN